MRQKLIAAGIALTLVTIAAVGTFASQDPVNVLEDPTATATETSTAEATDTPEGTATATATPDGTETPEATATGTPEPTATGSAEATETPDGEEDDDDVHGIPESNPSHHDEDGDGVCEKGEAIIKTTPSGNQVRVPCQTAKHEGKEKHGKNADDADDEADESDEDDDSDDAAEEDND